jgi:hypothetical protein
MCVHVHDAWPQREMSVALLICHVICYARNCHTHRHIKVFLMEYKKALVTHNRANGFLWVTPKKISLLSSLYRCTSVTNMSVFPLKPFTEIALSER